MKDFSEEFAAAAQAEAIKRDALCESIVDQLIQAGEEPAWSVPSGDINGIYAYAADCYWRRKFYELPSVTTGIRCAQWLSGHTTLDDAVFLTERWAGGYGYLNRDSVNNDDEVVAAYKEIAEFSEPALAAYFCLIYQGAKLRANFNGTRLLPLFRESLLAELAGDYRNRPLATALTAFGAFRMGANEIALAAVESVWSHSERSAATVEMCLHGMIMAADADRHLDNLLRYAAAAVENWPDAHLLHYRFAMALRLSGEFSKATQSIDRALDLLPATGKRVSHHEFQERYLQERISIEQSQQTYRMVKTLISEMMADRER